MEQRPATGASNERPSVASPRAPSRIAALERSASLASETLYAIDLQLRRLRTTEPEDEVFIFRWFTDLQFLIILLRRMERLARMASTVATDPEPLHQARQVFLSAAPDVRTMRNVTAHIDDYALDRPTRYDKAVRRQHLQNASWRYPEFGWLHRPHGTRRVLNVETARDAAVEIYLAIVRERDAVRDE